ncbi:MAG TPA: hypothetical protein VL501_03000 [Pyrinomonadaceae bacterium]|nr:hypothetical protein [Pyrinomonadaceae bacterium]
MKRYDIRALMFVLLLTFAGFVVSAQTGRKSVPASEVNGTFEMKFTGRFKGNSNEVRIYALGGGKLHVAMLLTFPYTMGNGELMANVGELNEVFEIHGDEASFISNDNQCSLTIKFLRPGTIKVGQQGSDVDCGFGNRVSATGTYHKTSSKKPKFDDINDQ